MLTVEALQSLYIALGGEAADVAGVTVIPDAIAALKGVVESVINPAIEATKPFVVAITITISPGDASGTGTTDKTLAEIETAYNAGRKIVLRQNNGQYGFFEEDVTYMQNNGTSPTFYAVTPQKNPGGIMIISISEDNALVWEKLPFDAAEQQ